MKMPSFETLDAVWNWSLADALGYQGFLIWFVGALVVAVGVALWRKKKETVGLGLLFLLALPAVGQVSDVETTAKAIYKPNQWVAPMVDDKNPLAVAKWKELKQEEVTAAVAQKAQTDEVKMLQANVVASRQALQWDAVRYYQVELQRTHAQTQGEAERAAKVKYEAWKADVVAVMNQQWLAEAPNRAAIAASDQAAAMAEIAARQKELAEQQEMQNWLLQQQLALELAKKQGAQ